MPGRKEAYIPTKEQIIEACKEVQKSWTSHEKQKRISCNIKTIEPVEEKDNV